MKLSMKLKLILPLLTIAHVSDAAKTFPRRSTDEVLLVACAKGVEAHSGANNGDNVTAVAKVLGSSATPFEDSRSIDPSILDNLTAEEVEVVIIGFVTLLMLPNTGIALKSAIDAAEKLASNPNSPDYFHKFVNTVKDLKSAERADAVFSKLTAAKSCLPQSLVKQLEVIEAKYGFKSDSDKLKAITAMLRNNKNYK